MHTDVLPLCSLVLMSFHFTRPPKSSFFFFFNDTATTEIYTLSLHDALPIYGPMPQTREHVLLAKQVNVPKIVVWLKDRKSTRLNSSHGYISYAVFCLKKKTRSPWSTPSTSASRSRKAGWTKVPACPRA